MKEKYSADDVVILVGNKDSYGSKDYIVLSGFADGSFIQSPKMWHTAELLEDGNWKVCVEHKGSRILTIVMTDEKYRKYGIDKLQPTTENPFKVEYNDEDLIMVQK